MLDTARNRTRLLSTSLAGGTTTAALVLTWLQVTGLRFGDDLFYDLRTGAWVLAHLAVPRTDPWSWTAHGQPWVAHEWLWGVLANLLWRAAGWPGIEVFVALSAVLCWAALTRSLRSRAHAHLWAVLAIGFAMPFWVSRPQAASYAAFAATLLLLARARRSDWPWAAALGALWSNLHGGSAVIGPGMLAAAGGLELVGRDRNIGRAQGQLIVAAALAAGTLVNPWGPGMWLYTFEKVVGPEYALVRHWTIEWRPDLTDPYFLALTVLLGTAIVSAARRGAGWRDLILSAPFWVAYLEGARYLPYLILWSAWALTPGSTATEHPARTRPWAPLVLAAASTGLAAWAFAAGPGTPFPPGSPGASYLAAARTDLAWERKLHTPCANTFMDGAFVLYLGGSPSIDARADPYVPNGVFKRYIRFSEGLGPPPGRCAVLARLDTTRGMLDWLHDHRWQEAAATPDARVFLERGLAS